MNLKSPTVIKEKEVTTNSKIEEYINKASNLQKENKLDSAIIVLESVLSKVRNPKLSYTNEEEATIYFNLGNYYRQKAAYALAVEMYEKGLSLAIKNSMFLKEAQILNSLGGLYTETGNYEKGLLHCREAILIFESKFSYRKRDICLLLANIGNIQIPLGNFDDALVKLNKALDINKEIKNEYYFSLIYSGIGLAHLKKQEYKHAIRNFNLGVESSKKSNNTHSEIANLANLGSVYIEQKKYTKADSILLDAKSKAIDLDDKYLLKEVLSILIKLKKTTGDYEKTAKFQEQYISVKDSLFTDDLNNKLAVLDLNYQNLKKEKEILSLKLKNQEQSYQLDQNRLFLIIGLVVFLILGLVLTIVMQRSKLKSTNEIAELQNKMFRLQIRPHFIFNVLSSIQAYISNNDSRKAVVFLSKFARLMRNVLEQSQNEFNSISHEVRILSYYLELQQLRFERGFSFSFVFDEDIDTDVFLIPPLILQPIIENSIEHGINTSLTEGEIEIVFRIEAKALFVEIIDNGVGIESIKKKNTEMSSLLKTESLSMKIISEQLAYYSKRMKSDFYLKYKDLSENNSNGTKVTIKMPFQTLKAE